MTLYYTFLIFVLIQLSTRYTKVDGVLTKDSVCENGMLVQYTNSYNCKCPVSTVHKSETECVAKTALKKCAVESELNAVCGAYATCQKKADADTQTEESKKYECVCNPNYERDVSVKDTLKQCKPVGCKDKKCEHGYCVLGADNKAFCACHIGYELEGDVCKKKETPKACDLTCVSPATCKELSGVHVCSTHESMLSAALKEEAVLVGSTGNSVISALSQFNIYIIIVAFLFVLKEI